MLFRSRRGWVRIEVEAWRRAPRIVLATVVMGSAIMCGNALLSALLDVSGSSLARIAVLAIIVAAGLGVYLISLQALGVTSARILIRAVRDRL